MMLQNHSIHQISGEEGLHDLPREEHIKHFSHLTQRFNHFQYLKKRGGVVLKTYRLVTKLGKHNCNEETQRKKHS